MIVALIAGQSEDRKFPGRNTFPLLGRPMLVYPILAAQNAKEVDRIFLTTDSLSIERVASGLGVTTLSRSPEISGPSVRLTDVVMVAAAQVVQAVGETPEAVVLLLCNAPTVTGGLIDHGVEILRKDPSLDAVMSVSLRNEFHPSYALRMGDGGLLRPYAADGETSQKTDEAYFPDALLWVFRPRVLTAVQNRQGLSDWPMDCAKHRVFPLVHEGYGDVDYVWQVPAIEEWLRRQGFSQETTPYSARDARPISAARPERRPEGRRALVTTIPFGDVNRKPLDLLDQEGVEYVINPIGRRLRPEELANMIGEVDVLIAGTEPITAAVLDRAKRLRLISRVGIGLDSVDLQAARQRDILVSYTPDAPAPAVAEMTMGLMLSLLRSLSQADRAMRGGIWHRLLGRRLSELTVGVIGVGRVGKRLIRHLQGFAPRLLANDLAPDCEFGMTHHVQWVEKDTIYKESDIISLHIPLTPLTNNLITRREMDMMKPDAVLINTSRGGMVNEHDLAQVLRQGRLAGAALDVFGQEPYSGELVTIENCLLTCHMGSMSSDCRARMELEATEEAVRFFKGEPLRLLVPEDEYHMRQSGHA
ncbi:MAG: NAD(P)-dependent oxidoreductase [Nitrospiraceae bacterium]